MIARKLEFSFKFFKRIHLSFYCWPYRCMPFNIVDRSNMLIERCANSIWDEYSTAIGRFASMITNFSSVYVCSISQRDDGWKCVCSYQICPSTLHPLIVLKAPGTFALRGSSLLLLPLPGHLLFFILFNKYHYWHSNFQQLCQFYPKIVHIVLATWLKLILKINFPCNTCHLWSSDFRLNWFLSKCWTQCWPHLWFT